MRFTKHWTRGHPLRSFLYILLICCICLAGLSPTKVYADKNDQVAGFVMIGGNGLEKMHNAVANQEQHDGDVDQHVWIHGDKANPFAGQDGAVQSGLESVLDKAKAVYAGSSDPSAGEDLQPAVIVWIGEDYYDTNIPGYGEWFDNDWLGRDSASLCKDAAEYSGTALGRALAGYDYYVLVPKYKEGVSEDVVPNEAVHIKYPNESAAQAHKPVPEYEYEDRESEEYPDNLGTGESVNGDVTTVNRPVYGYVENEDGTKEWTQIGEEFDHYEYNVQYTKGFHYWIEEKEHKQGYAETWKENWKNSAASKGQQLKVYVASLAPVSKETNTEEKDKTNKPVTDFNSVFKANAPGLTWINIFDPTDEHEPYFENKAADKGRYYDDETYQWIFHLMWNTVLTLNPNEEPEEAVDHSFYSISSSLTSYLNELARSTPETSGSKIPMATSPGTAGGLLGYGDKDYDFFEYITQPSSQISSQVAYTGLVGLDSGGNLLSYARYGRLLNDMGFDATGSSGMLAWGRLIPGIFMFIVYGLSSAVNVAFSATIALLQFFNPFQFLSKASEISTEMKTAMLSGTDNGLQSLSWMQKPLQWVGEIYDGFAKIGAEIIIPFSLAILIAFVLMSRNYSDKMKKVNAFLIRMVFIFIGIPVMGMLYAQVLDNMKHYTAPQQSASTQMIASTFVDFGSWAQTMRLDPVADGVFESKSEGVAGAASDNTYKNLRKTTWLLNHATGATDKVVGSAGFTSALNSEDELKWVSQILSGTENADESAVMQCANLLTSYMSGSKYYSSDFEADSMGAFNRNHIDRISKPESDDEDASDEDTESGEVMLYDMYQETNTLEAWKGRSEDDNRKIFANEKSEWDVFNLMGNSSLKVDSTDPDSTVTFVCNENHSGSDSGGNGLQGSHVLTHEAYCPCSVVGLSSMSMYNYLNTDFGENVMTIYSGPKAVSDSTRVAHYSVNLIGSGVFHVLYWLNSFAVLGVITILGVVYALGMVVQGIKRTLKFLVSIPGALLGFLRSIVSIITTFIMMILEIVGTMFVYFFMSDLIMAVVSVMEGPLNDAATAASNEAGSGTIILKLASIVENTVGVDTKMALGLTLGGVILLCIVLAVVLILKRRQVLYAWNLCMELIWFKALPREVVQEYLRREALEKETKPVSDYRVVWNLIS